MMKRSQRVFRALLLISLVLPMQIFAAAGDLYVTSIDEETPANGSVIKISPDGTVQTVASPIPDPYGIYSIRRTSFW